MDCNLKQISGSYKSNAVYISRKVDNKKGNMVYIQESTRRSDVFCSCNVCQSFTHTSIHWYTKFTVCQNRNRNIASQSNVSSSYFNENIRLERISAVQTRGWQ